MANILRAANDQLGKPEFATNVVLRTANNAESAKVLIDEEFFDLALIDLRLGPNNSESGRSVIEHILLTAPSCETVVMSAFVDREESAVLNLVSPLAEVRIPVFRKTAGEEMFAPLVRQRLARWHRRVMRVEGIETLVGELVSGDRAKRLRLGRRSSRAAVTEEVSRLFFSLFGGRLPGIGESREVGLRIESVHRGLSASLAVEVLPLLGRSHNGDDVLGNRCIVKIGRLAEVRAEAAKFNEFVRYGVPSESRVELFDFAGGDKLGAVCYSFAGGASGQVTSLEDKIRGEAELIESPTAVDTVVSCITSLFSVDTRQWYQVNGRASSCGSFFESTLSARLLGRAEDRDSRLESAAHEAGGTFDHRTGRMNLDDLILKFPTRALLGNGELQREFPTCLVHGDMHAGNIMLDEAGRVRLIDFAQAGPGPRPIDAAVLSGSIRIWDMHSGPGLDAPAAFRSWLAARVAREKALRQTPGASTSARVQRWEGCVRELERLLKLNFQDITDDEISICMLLQATRLLTLSVPDPRFYLRIGAWLTPLVEWLERKE